MKSNKDLSYFDAALNEIHERLNHNATLQGNPVEFFKAHLAMREVFKEIYDAGFSEGFELGSKNIEKELKKENDEGEEKRSEEGPS